MKRVNHGGRPRTKADVRAVRCLNLAGAEVDPEFRISLAKTNCCRPDFQLHHSNRRKKRLIKTRRCSDITYRDRDVIDHAGASDLTSLNMMESIRA